MTRQLSLAACECWDAGERLYMPEQFGGLLFFDPLFKYVPGRAVSVYYNYTDEAQNMQPLLDFLTTHQDWFLEKKKVFDAQCAQVRELVKSNSRDHSLLFKLICEIWPTLAVANACGITEFYDVDPELLGICVQIRNESDDVLHPALTYLGELIGNQFVTYSEFASGAVPSDEILQVRSQGFFYHAGVVHLKQPNGLLLVEADHEAPRINSLKGSAACRGIVQGPAAVVFELSDLEKVSEGSVLVAPMTTPDMMAAIHKAVAIVTDEGGITCHAAIVARELSKPAVIGTKQATKMIRDGMMIEVDADHGLVNF